MMDGLYDGMGGGWWIVMTLFWLLLIAVIVWAGARLFPGRRDEPRERAVETPEEELDHRLVRGEVDVKTYEELREKLRASRAEGGWAR